MAYWKKFDRFSAFKGHFWTEHEFLIHWIYSTEKKKRDRNTYTTRLRKTEAALSVLMSKLNMGKHRRKEYIESKLQEIFKKFETTTLYEVEIHEVTETERKQ